MNNSVLSSEVIINTNVTSRVEEARRIQQNIERSKKVIIDRFSNVLRMKYHFISFSQDLHVKVLYAQYKLSKQQSQTVVGSSSRFGSNSSNKYSSISCGQKRIPPLDIFLCPSFREYCRTHADDPEIENLLTVGFKWLDEYASDLVVVKKEYSNILSLLKSVLSL